jgi:CO/xanthine dehydrogenase Mo-binding subunit
VGGSSVLRPVKLYPLAVDKVRYFGEPVVAVIADNRYLAEDATEAVSVDYEMLPVVVDPEASMEPGAPLVHEDAGSNIVYQYHFATDGIDKIFQEADVVIKEKIRSHRITACPIEPRAYLAHYNKDEDTLKGQLFYHRNPNEAAKFIMEVLRITDFNEAKDIWRERDKQASEIAKIGQATEEVMMTNNKCIDI